MQKRRFQYAKRGIALSIALSMMVANTPYVYAAGESPASTEEEIGYIVPDNFERMDLAGAITESISITKNTVIVFTGDTNINVTSGNGIEVSDGVTLTLALCGHSVTITTTATTMAGIRLPSSATLIVREGTAEDGTLTVKGGPGIAPESGQNGATGSGNQFDAVSGPGGAGGTGGSAPGAGIGGNGGAGGAGAQKNRRVPTSSSGTQRGADGATGGTGKSSADTNCGTVYLFGRIAVTSSGGDLPSSFAWGGIGDSGSQFGGRAILGGGGGGGAGGSAWGAPGIGTGGYGGGGGGAGGSGSASLTPSEMQTHNRASGGGGGGGQTGGAGGGAAPSRMGWNYVGSWGDGVQGTTVAGGAGGVSSGATYLGGSGGTGGARAPIYNDTAYKSTYVSTESRLMSSTSAGSNHNSPANRSATNKDLYLLSECKVSIEDKDQIEYQGTPIIPKLVITDKQGRNITSVLNQNYTISYDNNTDAGTNTAKVIIRSSGTSEDAGHLYVEGGSQAFTFTIHPNDDPIQIKKQNTIATYTYGESFQATVEENDYNDGRIVWSGVQDETHTGDVYGASDANKTTDVILSKAGKLKLKVSIIPDKVNSNGTYNFTEKSATLDYDIDIKKRNIQDGVIDVPNLKVYTYIGAQIQPKYTAEDGNTPIKYATNKDRPRIDLTETEDYDLEYGENLNATGGGQGQVTIRGVGNYEGESKQTFTISPRDILAQEVSVTLSDQVFTGLNIHAEPTLKILENTLPASDRTLNWESYDADNTTLNTKNDLINVGKKRVSITGTGNIINTRIIDFQILKADIGTVDLAIAPAKDVYFDAREIESRPSLKYNNIILTEDQTPVDSSVPIINPNDYQIAFQDHKEAGTATITLTGMENFSGTRELHYEVMPRPLHVIPDAGQWKYYGAQDIFGYYQDEEHPTYKTYIRKLSADATQELKDAQDDEKNQLFVADNLPLAGYPIQLLGELSREGADDIVANDKPNTNYPYTLHTMKLSDTTKRNYDVQLVDNENYYKLEHYLYDGPIIELEGTIGKNEWYIGNPALLRAPQGFNISKKDGMDDQGNPWAPTISYDDGDYSKDGVSYFVRVSNPGDPANGAISSSLTKQFKQDTVHPTGNLIMNSDSFSALNGGSEFNFYLNSDLNGMILAKDALSQVSSKLYFISDKKMGKEELDRLTVPKEGDNIYNPIGGGTGIPTEYDGTTWIDAAQFRMSIDYYNTQRKMLYVRIEDHAGNVTYINGDGVVFDKDAPILHAEYEQDGEWTTKEDVFVSGNVHDETSGLKDRYVAYQVDEGALQIIDTKDIHNGDFKIQQIPDGNYDLTISAWDKADNQAAPIVFHVMKDTKQPRIILEADTATIATEQLIKFKPDVGASEVAKLEVRFNDGKWSTVENGILAAYYARENGTYAFRVTNGAGVVSKESSITFTKIDTKEPVVEVTVTKANGETVQNKDFVNSAINILFKNAEKNLGNSRFEYQLDGGSWTEVTENLDNEARLSLSETEGSHTVKLRITAVNGLADEQEFQYAVDYTKPTVAGMITIRDAEERGIFKIFQDLFTNKKQEVIMNATDGGSGVASTQHYIVEGRNTIKNLPTEDKAIEKMVNGTWEDGTSCKVEKSSEYVVYFKVTDKAGNIAYSRSDRIVINEAPPEIEVTYDKEGEWDNNPSMEVYAWDENPGIDSVSYQIDDGPVNDGVEQFTLNNMNLPDGNHTVVIEVKDKSGNQASKTVNIQQDSGTPTITAVEGTATDREVKIAVEASYAGPSGLAQILISKNGQDFEDITEEIERTGTYIADENGAFIFRAVTGAGAVKDVAIQIDKFSATELDLEAVASAKTADGKSYESNTWSNQGVTLYFSNKRANLKGLDYWLKTDDGDWRQITAIDGYVDLSVNDEAEHHYEFKVSLTGTPDKESNVATLGVKVDKTAPDAQMKIKDISWNDAELVTTGFGFDHYFNQSEYAHVTSQDTRSGIKETKVFVMKEKELPDSVKGVTSASKVEELGKDRWRATDRLVIDPNDTYVAFGKVYDHAGNVTYVCSDGLVFDDINPTLVSDIDQVNWYRDDATTITFDTNDNLAEVEAVTYTINGQAEGTAVLEYGSFTLSSGQLENGINQIKIDVKDHANNVLTSEFVAKKDSETPVITVKDETPSDKLATKRHLSIAATAGASGLAKVEVKTPDAGGWTDITDTFKEGFIAEEKGTYWFRAVSHSGVNQTTNITLDKISKDIPVIAYIMTNADGSTYYDGQWKNEQVKVQFTNENANQIVEKYLYRVDDGAYMELEEERDNSAIFGSHAGTHTYTMKLVLDNGLESEEVSVSIRIDKRAPELRVNSDLSQWVKGSQDLEVEVIEHESGIASDGYSFDNGFTWQAENKATIRANKLVGIHAKDDVANMSKVRVAVDKIDSQGPTVEAFTEIGQDKAKERELEADISDFKDLTRKAGSGIKEVYVMTNYPYKNGEFEANPSKTFAMTEDNGAWMTQKPVTVPYNGTNDVWLVAEDQVGNVMIYSTKVNNMIGSGDEEGNTEKPDPIEPTPDKPTPDKPTPDKPTPDKPTPDKPTPDKPTPDKPENPAKPNKPGDSSGTGSEKTPAEGTKGGKTSGEAVQKKNEEVAALIIEEKTEQKVASSLSKSDEDVKKLEELDLAFDKDGQDKEGVKSAAVPGYILIIPWILVVLAVIWALYLWRRYQKFKQAYEEENEKKNEEEV